MKTANFNDDMAMLGYQYAAGSGEAPDFSCDMDFAAFNCGITNFNVRNHKSVPRLKVAQVTLFNDRTRISDKCLGIVGT